MTKLNELRRLLIQMRGDILTTAELSSLGFGKAWLRYALKALVKEGALHRLKKGVYSRTKPDRLDPLKTATLLYGGYLGLSTAAYVYGWTDEYQYTVYVMTENSSGKRKLGRHEIRAVAVGKKLVGSRWFRGYTVSSRAKTMFDLFYFTNMVGKESVKKYASGAELSKKEWKEFVGYAKKFGSKSLCQRTGYILEKTGRKFRGLEKLMPKNPVVVKLGDGRLNKRWMVVDG